MSRVKATIMQSWKYPFVLSLIALLATYSIVLVAIDTGSLLAYGATLIVVFHALYFLKMAVKLAFSNDKKPRARAAKKAH